MATNLSGSIRAQISMKLNSGDLSLTQGQVDAIEAFSINLTNGTGAGQADLFHNVNVAALAASGTSTYDLDAGTLEDRFGNGLTFVKVKAILLFHLASSSSSSIKLGGDFVTTTNLGTNNIVAGGFALYGDPTGFTVTASTADELTVVNNDGSNAANYDIFIIGTSA